MDINAIKQDVFETMEAKGFHDMQYTNHQALVFRQICHLFSEYYEATWATDQERPEEVADIVIVLMDLSGLLGIDMYPLQHTNIPRESDVWLILLASISQISQSYRKTGQVSEDKINDVLQGCYALSIYSNFNLLNAIERKMAKNKARPHRYGVAR
jgi:NTP pyrophosphatase (non-canonical NTP hydrolase)